MTLNDQRAQRLAFLLEKPNLLIDLLCPRDGPAPTLYTAAFLGQTDRDHPDRYLLIETACGHGNYGTYLTTHASLDDAAKAHDRQEDSAWDGWPLCVIDLDTGWFYEGRAHTRWHRRESLIYPLAEGRASAVVGRIDCADCDWSTSPEYGWQGRLLDHRIDSHPGR